MNNNKKDGKVFVWPISTRIIHWMFAFFFTSAFITSFFEDRLYDHVALGFIFGIMIIYRIIWGFVGPEYATFKTFKLSLPQLKHYFVEKVQNRWRKIPAGHNPASSWFTVWALLMGTLIVVTGLLLYGIQEAKGFLSYLNDDYTAYMHILALVHEAASYIFLAWVFLHISGVMVEQFYHKTNMIFAMITGYKKTEGKDTKVRKRLSFFAYIMILISAGTYFFIISSDYNFLTTNKFIEVDYKSEHRVYANECGGDCHKTYPPFLLPKRSWEKVIKSLDNHRGKKITDQNISISKQSSILEYLKANSAETSTRESAVKTMYSLGMRRPKAITKTPYWRETHKSIPKAHYKHKKIKDKSNCFACHNGAEEGVFDDRKIVYPEKFDLGH